MEESESAAFRDRIAELYVKCRCGNKEAYAELESLAASSSSHPSPEDTLVVKGYLGDLLLISKSQLIPYNESRGKALLSELSVLEGDTLTCKHLYHLLGVYHHDVCNMKAESIVLFQKAADQGHLMSISSLGFFNDYGIGVRANCKKAFSFYMSAAEKGYPIAQCNVGKCYDSGYGCDEDAIQAAMWFQRAAEHGYVDALFNLGVFYQTGRGVRLDLTKSAEYFKMAADQGDPAGMYNLACSYHNGNGVPHDNSVAFQLCKMSAAQGDALATQYLGMAYEKGWGTEVSIIEAMRYYRRASFSEVDGVRYSRFRVQELATPYKEEVFHEKYSESCAV